MKTRSKNGFTLVEILIVVVILGILAAIVIPQFSQASSEARESSVKSNLQMVRSQIELYKIQHNDTLPGATAATLISVMTNKTDIDGTLNATGDYGPYMQKFPVNAINDLGGATDGTEIQEGTTNPSGVDADDGWFYNTATAEFFAVDATNTEIHTW